ncbi:MAG: uracil-DNA glycosylase [Nitrospira sp.]
MSTDRPKLLGDATAVAVRMKELRAPHIAPLTSFVEDLRAEAGPGAEVPYFDPWDGGVEATTLFLLEAPGAKAVHSGFVSRNNPDETAKNFFELNVEAGINRKRTVIWNAVPWYIGNGRKIRAATPKDLTDGLKPLPRLLALLPNLREIVLVGRKAEKAAAQLDRSSYAVFTCPHPSPMFVNHAPGNRGKILAVLRQLVVQQRVPADGLASPRLASLGSPRLSAAVRHH